MTEQDPWLTVLSSKLIRVRYTGSGGDRVLHEHWCPGCRMMHQIAVEQPFRNGARWTWDGNAAAPTFSPSIHIRLGRSNGGADRVCHYFIRGGRIEFCGDSTHALSGQAVDLPDIPPEERLA